MPSFPRVLAVTPIVSPLADKGGQLSRRATGTGPYKFVEWKTGEYVLEERNEQYWGPRPAVKQLKWIWTSEPVLMNMSVLAGEADIVNPLPPMFAEALSRNPKVKLLNGSEVRVFWVALNTAEKTSGRYPGTPGLELRDRPQGPGPNTITRLWNTGQFAPGTGRFCLRSADKRLSLRPGASEDPAGRSGLWQWFRAQDCRSGAGRSTWWKHCKGCGPTSM